jgi:hypothetical protein
MVVSLFRFFNHLVLQTTKKWCSQIETEIELIIFSFPFSYSMCRHKNSELFQFSFSLDSITKTENQFLKSEVAQVKKPPNILSFSIREVKLKGLFINDVTRLINIAIVTLFYYLLFY